MTRRARERRQERAAEKQRAQDERAERERRLAARPEWRQLLHAIDGDGDEPLKPAARPARARSSSIAHDLQWKSTLVPVAAAGVFQLPVKLDAPKGVLRYAFSTRDYDLNFGVQMICADGTMMELLELRRYESQKRQVEGSVELTGPGMVLLLWDNSYSWVNPKQLSYTVELHQDAPPETAAERAQLAQRARLERQRRLLRAETSVDALEASIHTHEQGAEQLRLQIQELQAKLERNEAAKAAAAKARERVDDEIDTLCWELNALSWRCLDDEVFDRLFSCLDSRSMAAWSITSKTWQQRIREFQAAHPADNQLEEAQNDDPAST